MRVKTPQAVLVEDQDFRNAWSRAVWICSHNGMMISASDKIGAAVTKDIQLTVAMNRSAVEQIEMGLLHPQSSCKEKLVQAYKDEYTYDYVVTHHQLPEEKQFEYMYMDRFVNYPMNVEYLKTLKLDHPMWKYLHPYDNWNIFDEDGECTVPLRDCTHFDQLAWLHDAIREQGISRQHQIITWIPGHDNFSLNPPCLQKIQVRVLRSKTDKIEGPIPVEVQFNFRSRDIYGAFPSNEIGLVAMLNRYVFTGEYEIASLIDVSKSAHIYQGDWDVAHEVRKMPVMYR